MAATTAGNGQKKMEFKQVDFDVNEIAPDAPEGEWMMSIPRGKCKVQPTKEEKLPLLIVPVRLDSTEEEGDKFQKALGNEKYEGVETRIDRWTRVPQAMLTGKGDVSDKVSGINAGADDYIVKPFEPQELLARIKMT